MERRVKERLIGAAILVAILVGVVPELLSGPKRVAVAPPLTLDRPAAVDGVRSVTVDLTTSKATASTDGAAADGVAADGTAADGTAAGSTNEERGGERGGEVAHPVAAPLTPPSSAASPPITVVPATPNIQSSGETGEASRAWSIQLGSFASKVNADTLAHQLKAQGTPVYVIATGSKAAARFKVRVGPMADRGSAERSLSKLKAQGHSGTLIAPDS